MRIDEFTSAEEQLALWKLVSDNVWQAISTQAEQQKRAQAEKAAQVKAKRGVRGKGASKRKAIPRLPTVPPLRKLEPSQQHNTAPAVNKQQASVGKAQQPLPTQAKPTPSAVTSQPPQQKLATPTQIAPPMGGGMAQPQAKKPTLIQPTTAISSLATPQQNRKNMQKAQVLRRNSAL